MGFSNSYRALLEEALQRWSPLCQECGGFNSHNLKCSMLAFLDRANEALSRGPKHSEWKDAPTNARWPSEWLKAGMKIRLESGRVLLVGDVNELLGVCDCCREQDEIVAYQEPLDATKEST